MFFFSYPTGGDKRKIADRMDFFMWDNEKTNKQKKTQVGLFYITDLKFLYDFN